jgi:hypothetical protein
MELLILVPLAISIGNFIFTSCINQRLSYRIQKLEHNLTNQTHQYNPVPPSYTQAPPPSAPPGYGYQLYPGDPSNQGLNVV